MRSSYALFVVVIGLILLPNPSLARYPESASNMIIGFLDTGIWPESKSFNDSGLGPVPSHWKGKCEEGAEFPSSNCNRKIIGARFFTKEYEAVEGPIDEREMYKSPRDEDGHGTHVSSIAAGSPVPRRYTSIRGIASDARIAMYKVCWNDTCYYDDVLAGMDKAIKDGVDIISVSLGSETLFNSYDQDPLAVASFAAMVRGILVSFAAGNEGPDPRTVVNVAPWVITVGAATYDNYNWSGVTSFSSRGPSTITPGILKPDVLAPGLYISAAGIRKQDFKTLSGTSMACPYVSGVGARIKAANPIWSPAAIRSAIMTTAYDGNNHDGETPYDYGAGHVDAGSALHPGLVYNNTLQDYIDLLCAENYTPKQIKVITKSKHVCNRWKAYSVGDFNYPSFSVPFYRENKVLKYSRTLTNVGKPGTYKVSIYLEKDTVEVEVEPNELTFTKMYEKKQYSVTFTSKWKPKKDTDSNLTTTSGSLVWSDGKHRVRSVMVFLWDSERTSRAHKSHPFLLSCLRMGSYLVILVVSLNIIFEICCVSLKKIIKLLWYLIKLG